MDDKGIVSLYWARNEQAITESSEKYGAYLSKVAYNILRDRPDAEECVNDTWLKAWNAMPPHKPSVLSAFLGKITRNLSFDLYKRKRRDKRGGENIDLVLDELAEVVSGRDDTEESAILGELKKDIGNFVASLPEKKRYMFILRYFYAEGIGEIAERFNMSKDSVSVNLNRIRVKLKTYLTDRGYDI